MRPQLPPGYPNQVLSIGRVTLGEKARKLMKQKQTKEKEREAILRAACALLNSGGGVIQVEADDQRYDYSTDALGQDIEIALHELVYPAAVNDFFEFSQQGSQCLMFVKSWCSSSNRARICSLSTGLYQRSETSVMQVSPSAVNEVLLRRRKKASQSDKIYQLYRRNNVNKNEILEFGESMTVDFKDFRSEKLSVRLGECLPKYISAFANTAGGFLFIGVNDERKVTGCGRGESREKLEARVEELCSKPVAVHRQDCSKNQELSVEHRFIDVLAENASEPGCYVLAIRIPAFCCAVFEKQPDSWQIMDSELHSLTAEQWLGMMESTDPVDELTGRFQRQLSLNGAPPQCRTVYGFQEEHLKQLQARLFPVDEDEVEDILCGPDGLKTTLGESALETLKKLQTLDRREDAPGILIFSRSWAVDIGLVRNRHVILDALLICQNSLPCLYTVVEEGSQDVWEYATSTAFHLKQKLVNVGGYSERVCVVPKLVHCLTGELIPRELYGPAGLLYPDSYRLGGVDEVESVLRCLVIVLLSFTSALSDELGCEFLNLLTEEQFEFLQTHEGMNKLFVHGLPGTGKTVLAAEKMKRIKNSHDCNVNNILYICENQPLKNFMCKMKICRCETRKTFMKDDVDFSKVKHIIVDEGQNFRSEDGDWIEKARKIVGEDGVLWVFLDYFQQSHNLPTGLPPLPSQNWAGLFKVVRNSQKVFDELKRKIDDICVYPFTRNKHIANHLKAMGSKLTFVHSLQGNYEEKEMAECKVVPHLRKVLWELNKDGVSQKDIAILCSTQDAIEKFTKDLQSEIAYEESILFTPADDVGNDAVVLDSIRRFSGLERNVVILIDPRAHQFHSKVEPNLLLAAFSRARIRLIVIFTGNETDSTENEMDSTVSGTDVPLTHFQDDKPEEKIKIGLKRKYNIE